MSYPTKAITAPIGIKDLEKGEVTAIVSTFNICDLDGDVILSHAIKDGSRVKLSAWAHDCILEKKAPAGAAVVTVTGDHARLDGRYFLETQRGREAFEVVKGLGSDCQWSIGYLPNVKVAPMTDQWAKKGARRLIAGMELVEASAVFFGANQHTRTLTAKGSLTAAELAALRAIDLRLHGENLPKRFHGARDFACKQLGLGAHEAPTVRLVPTWQFQTGNLLSEYDAKGRVLRINEELPYETVVHCLFHDLARHAATITHDPNPERFAHGAEGVLVRRWRAYQ